MVRNMQEVENLMTASSQKGTAVLNLTRKHEQARQIPRKVFATKNNMLIYLLYLFLLEDLEPLHFSILLIQAEICSYMYCMYYNCTRAFRFERFSLSVHMATAWPLATRCYRG